MNWTRNDLCNILLSDDSRFPVHPDNISVFNWKVCGTRSNPGFVWKNARFGSERVMVYAGIYIGRRCDLHIIQNGAVADLRCRDDILRPITDP